MSYFGWDGKDDYSAVSGLFAAALGQLKYAGIDGKWSLPINSYLSIMHFFTLVIAKHHIVRTNFHILLVWYFFNLMSDKLSIMLNILNATRANRLSGSKNLWKTLQTNSKSIF